MRTCPVSDCSNHGTQFDANEESVYCPKCGSRLIDVSDIEEEA